MFRYDCEEGYMIVRNDMFRYDCDEGFLKNGALITTVTQRGNDCTD